MNTLTRSSIWLHAVVLTVLVAFSFNSHAQDGEKLFRANCASCHKLDKKLVGPALAGVQDRWESEEALIAWIQNSQQYLADNPGDQYAADLFAANNNMIMPAMPLSNEDTKAILDYIANPPAPKEAGPAPGPEGAPADSGKDYTLYWLLAFLAVFLIVIKVLIDVKNSVKGLLYEVKPEAFGEGGEFADFELTPKQKFGYWMNKNKALVALVGVLALVFVLNVVYEGLMSVGVYEGYAPTQPIKFSHKIHAGDNGINCVYCHSSAEKGKHSGIPSVNVCMNCHKGISEGSLWGTEEISKIYAAAGFNPETGAYDKEGKAVEWVRIHNLPDHVYFNHSQHVVVGKIACQTCHGPVETFDYPMKQHAPLTMGWCIDCHRETEVKMDGNGYYDKIHAELVEKYKDQGLEKFTEAQNGGLECAKCHY